MPKLLLPPRLEPPPFARVTDTDLLDYPQTVTHQEIELNLWARSVVITDLDMDMMRHRRHFDEPWEKVRAGLAGVALIYAEAERRQCAITGPMMPDVLHFFFNRLKGFDFAKPISRDRDQRNRGWIFSQREYRGAF